MKKITCGEMKSWAALLMVSAGMLAGCGTRSVQSNNTSSSTSSSTAQQGPQTYLAGIVAGNLNDISEVLTAFQIDDKATTFAQSTFGNTGAQLNNSGSFDVLSRGLLGLKTSYSVPLTSSGTPPSQTGNWAVELAGQGGGLVQMNGQPVVPLVAARSCPNYSSAQSFLFVTIPAALTSGTGQESALSWNPVYDTAYGSVDISTSGQTVNFNNIHQYAADGTPLTSYQTLANTPAAISSLSGTCSSTFYGNSISVPGNLTLTQSDSNEPMVTPAGIVGIGPSGLLVESNGNISSAVISPIFQPFLGAGTGAIGLPKSSSAISVSALTSAQYLGFSYGSGNAGNQNGSGWSSQLTSFGFPSVPSNCQAVAAPTPTMIYGSDFSNTDLSTAAAQGSVGFGNCDMAIDLGPQDSANPGLFSSAKVWVGTNQTPLGAVAIAGQLGGKYAIFLIGMDPNQAWGIYLLQSN